MSDKLLPCPFCGGEAILQPLIGAIVCNGCHVEVYAPRPLPRTEAYNRRAVWPESAQLLHLMRSLLSTRQGRTVGYEPPEVQALWRKVEKALEGKEGAK